MLESFRQNQVQMSFWVQKDVTFKISFTKGISELLHNHVHVTIIANISLALIFQTAKAIK